MQLSFIYRFPVGSPKFRRKSINVSGRFEIVPLAICTYDLGVLSFATFNLTRQKNPRNRVILTNIS